MGVQKDSAASQLLDLQEVVEVDTLDGGCNIQP